MALVVEDGTGILEAESYISVAEASEYHAKFGNEGWPADEAVAEAALRKATALLDARYAQRWRGERHSPSQGLSWPRAWAYDDDGNYLPRSALPVALKRLTAEVALLYVTDEEFDQPIQGGVRSTKVKVGPIQEDISYDRFSTYVKKYPVLQRLANALIEGSRFSVPILRS